MKALTPVILLAIGLLFVSCDERVHNTDSGGVLLELEFGAVIPFRVSVNDAVGSGSLAPAGADLVFNSIIAEPDSVTSSLMDIELESIEVTYERADGGTRLPPPYVVKTLATIPVGGSFTILGQELMSFEQLQNPPLSDLLYENGGFDKETGLTYVRLNLYIRAFGRTIGGRKVSSKARPHTMEFVQ